MLIKKLIDLRRDHNLRRLFDNSATLLSGNIITSIMGLITLALSARALGTLDFSIFVIITTFVLIIDRLVDFQSWQVLIKFGANKIKNNPEGFKALIKFGTILDFSSAIFGCILSVVLIYFLAERLGWSQSMIHLGYIYSIMIAFSITGTPIAILRLIDNFKVFPIVSIISSLIKLFGTLLVYLTKKHIAELIVISLIANIIEKLLLFVIGHINLKKENIKCWWLAKVQNWKHYFRYALWTNISSTFDLPVRQFDIMLVSIIISIEATGFYKIIKQSGQVLGLIADPVYKAIYPILSEQEAEGNSLRARRFAFRVGFILFALIGPVAIILSITVPIWLPAIFGKYFISAALPMAIYIILVAISILFVTIHPLFIAFGFFKNNAIIVLLANTIYIGLVLFLGHRFGLIGVVLSFAVQFSVIVGLKLYLIQKHCKKNIKN